MEQTRVGDLVPIIARNEPLFAEAYRAMVRGGPYPEPENALKQACLEIRHPMRQLCIVQLAAIRAQRPLEQVLAPTRANEDWVRSFYPEDTATIAECVLAENQPDMLLDEAQQLVFRDESPANLIRAIHGCDAEIAAATRLRNACARKLYRLGRGMQMMRTGRMDPRLLWPLVAAGIVVLVYTCAVVATS